MAEGRRVGVGFHGTRYKYDVKRGLVRVVLRKPVSQATGGVIDQSWAPPIPSEPPTKMGGGGGGVGLEARTELPRSREAEEWKENRGQDRVTGAPIAALNLRNFRVFPSMFRSPARCGPATHLRWDELPRYWDMPNPSACQMSADGIDGVEGKVVLSMGCHRITTSGLCTK